MRKIIGLALSLAVGVTAFAAVPALAKADVIVVPFFDSVFVQCANGGAGEIVTFEGTTRVVLRTTTNNGGGSSFTVSYNTAAKGTGADTGDTYQYHGTDNESGNVGSDGTPLVSLFVASTRVVGPGPGNNFYIRDSFHITYNGNGDIVVNKSRSTADCS